MGAQRSTDLRFGKSLVQSLFSASAIASPVDTAAGYMRRMLNVIWLFMILIAVLVGGFTGGTRSTLTAA